jgi:hypothetical protein
MTLIDDRGAGDEAEDDARRDRRGALVGLGVLVIFVVLALLFVVFGPPSAAASGGCGGG